MSKWIVQLDYEFGEFEPNSIYFRRVCSDDMEYGSAYDTKREALEAFCQGQYAINQLRKEKEAEQKEAEQKKEKGWDKAIKEAKEVAKAYEWFPRLKICGEQKPGERTDGDFSSKEEGRKPVFYSKTFPPTIEDRLAKIEERLTEIDGVLSSIGSPEWDLRKKVEKLEKGLEGLNTTFRLYSKNEIERSAVLEKNIDKLSENVFGSIEGKNT